MKKVKKFTAVVLATCVVSTLSNFSALPIVSYASGMTNAELMETAENQSGIDMSIIDKDNIRSAYVTDYQSFKEEIDTGNYYIMLPIKDTDDYYTVIIRNGKYSKTEKNFKEAELLKDFTLENLNNSFDDEKYHINNMKGNEFVYLKDGTEVDMYLYKIGSNEYKIIHIQEGSLAEQITSPGSANISVLGRDESFSTIIRATDKHFERYEEYSEYVKEAEKTKKSCIVAKNGTLIKKVIRSKNEVTKGRNDLNDVLEFSFTITEDFEGEVVDRVGNVGETAKARLEYYDSGNSEHIYLLYLSGSKGEIGLWHSDSFARWEAMNSTLRPIKFYADDRIADGQLADAFVVDEKAKDINLLIQFKGGKIEKVEIKAENSSLAYCSNIKQYNESYLPQNDTTEFEKCFDINYKVVGDGYNTLSGNYEYRKEPVHDSDDDEEELVHEYYKSDIENNNDSDKKDDNQKDDSKEDKTDKDAPKDEDKDVEDNKSDEINEQDKSNQSNPNDSADTTNQTLQQKIDALKSYGIVKGYADGEFYPERNITRAEFAKIVALISGYSEDMLTEDDDYFNDVSKEHWANKYINFCYKYGLVNGTASGDTEISESESETQKIKGLFSPEDNIIYQDAVKILVSALGGGEKVAEKGGYPNGYISVSKDMGIINTPFVGEEYINRGAVADAVYNALFISPDGSKTLYDKYFNKQ